MLGNNFVLGMEGYREEIMDQKLRILVVEDNNIQRGAIVSVIKKMKLPVEAAVLEAENGKQAAALWQKQPVDILLTDIKMPAMDGLELAKYVRANGGTSKIIFFTAYSDFDYAQKAIGLKAYDYVLKPLDPDELTSVLERAIAQWLRDRSEDREKEHSRKLGIEKQLYDALHRRHAREETIRQLMELPVFSTELQRVLVLADFSEPYQQEDDDLLQSELSGFKEVVSMVLELNEHQITAILASPKISREALGLWAEDFGRRLRDKGRGDVFISISNPFQGADMLYTVKNSLDYEISKRFYLKNRWVFLQEESPDANPGRFELSRTFEIKLLMQEMDDCLKRREQDRLLELIIRFFSVNDTDIRVLRYSACRIIEKLSEVYDFELMEADIKNISEAVNAEVLCSFVQEQFYAHQENSSGESLLNINRMEQIRKLIEENYAGNIGLVWLAEKLDLSPGYLSSLIRRETGENFMSYLTQVRIRHAALLLQGDGRIGDIAAKVGYLGTPYFSTIFKNIMGITPAKYRERFQKKEKGEEPT